MLVGADQGAYAFLICEFLVASLGIFGGYLNDKGGVFLESLIGFLISLAFAIFLFIDAPKHNKSRWLWAILGFIFGPIALGIYFIKTGRKVAGWIITILAILVYVVIIVLIALAAALMVNGFS